MEIEQLDEVLNNLLSLGLITSQKKETGEIVYKITERGKLVLKEMTDAKNITFLN